MLQGNGGRHGLINQGLERIKAERLQHRLDLCCVRTDMAIDKFASVLQRAEGGYGVVLGRS